MKYLLKFFSVRPGEFPGKETFERIKQDETLLSLLHGGEILDVFFPAGNSLKMINVRLTSMGEDFAFDELRAIGEGIVSLLKGVEFTFLFLGSFKEIDAVGLVLVEEFIGPCSFSYQNGSTMFIEPSNLPG